MDVFEKVKEIISETMDVDADEITMDTHMVDDLGADSLDVVEMSVEVEDAFNIKIEDDDIQSMLTVKDIVAYIEARV